MTIINKIEQVIEEKIRCRYTDNVEKTLKMVILLKWYLLILK